MKQEVKIDQADYTVFVLVRDDAGNAKTGVAFGDIDLAYARVETDNDVTTTDVAPADLAGPVLTDPHLDWGFLEVSAGDHPGLYRLDIADEVFAAGAWSAVVSLTGAGLEPSHLEFMMVPEQPYVGVEATSAVTAIGALHNFDHANDDVALVTLVTTTTNSTNAETAIGLLHNFDPANDDVAVVTLVDTTTANTDMRGTDGVSLVVPPSVAQLNARTLVAGNYAVAGTAMTLNAAGVDLIWNEVMEAGATARQSLTISNAFCAGITTGGATAIINFRNLADTVNRIRMTGVDADGDRTGVALDL